MPGFWQWYYTQGVDKAFLIYQSIILLTYDFFSIPLLLRTLFAPWKKDEVSPTSPSLQLMFQALWMNLIVRLLGAVIRSIMIIAGIIAIILTAIFGALLLFYAYILPVAVPASLIAALVLIITNNPTLALVGLVLIILALIALYCAFKGWLADRKSDILPRKKIADWQPGEDPAPWLSMSVKLLLSETQDITELKKRLVKKSEIIFILNRATLYDGDIINSAQNPNINLKSVLEQAAKLAQANKRPLILLGDLFMSIVTLDTNINQTLVNYGLNLIDLQSITNWQIRLWENIYAPSRLLNPKTLRFSGGIGKDWASGYTNYLDRFSRELNITVSSSYYDYQFIAHAPQIDTMEKILARSGKHNILLVGETGVGKKTTILGLARRILVGTTVAQLRYKRVLELDVSALLSSNDTGQLERDIIQVLNEAVRAGNVILFINSIDRLLQNNGSEIGSVNVGQLLTPYLQSNRLQLIATMSPTMYQTIITRQSNLESLFEKIDITEPDPVSILRILEDVSPSVENHYNLIVSYQSLKRVIETAARYIPNLKFPEKAIDLLDEVAANVAPSHKGIVEPEDVDKVISQKTNVPVGEAQTNEKEKLLHMEELMHKRVVNQTVAIGQIANAMRRSRAGVGNEKKPIGSFLFLGPTGVGKTETAKALAEVYFGSEKNMLRLDMSEFQEISALNSLIGDVNQGTGGRLTDGIRQNPFTCILLDEIEKAHPKILDIFLQVLDEGRLTDALGQVADFRNAIIIATSNAGAEWLRQKINEKITQHNPNDSDQIAIDMEQISKELIDQIQKDNLFRPEFLNRFDAVTAFRPLTAKELEQVVDFQLVILNQRLASKQITVVLNPVAKTKLAELGFNPEFGARALTRKMIEIVENKVAEALLKDEVKNGGTFEITPEMIQ